MSNQEAVEYIKKSFELKTQGFYKPAIEMLYKALDISPEDIEILEQLAQLYSLIGETDRAVHNIEKVLDKEPNHSDALLLLQKIQIDKKDFAKAKEINIKLCETSPKNENFITRIKILKQLGQVQEIYEFFASIQEPDDKVLFEAASVFYENNDIDKAKELLIKSSELNKDNLQTKQLLAKIYYDQKDYEMAKGFLNDILKKSQSPDAYNLLGLIYLNEDNSEKSIEFFSKAHKADEQNAQYLYNIASAYFLTGWFDEAAVSFRKAICLEPMNIDYHYSLAYLYYQQQNYIAAKGEVEAIKDIDDNNKQANILYAMILAKQGNTLFAKQKIDEIKQNDEQDDFAYYASYNINKELLNIDTAKKDLEKAIELKPDSINYLSDYLDFLLEQKDYEIAENIAKKILEKNNKFIQAHIALAKIYMLAGNFEQMHEEAQEIIELDTNCPEGYYYNAIALFEQGDRNFAIESLKKSISLDLNNAMLYLKMSEFYQDMNDLESAYSWALEASEIDERNYNYRWLCAKIARTLHKTEDALRNYSHCYRFASGDVDLCNDYAEFLNSVGRKEQAKRILSKIK